MGKVRGLLSPAGLTGAEDPRSLGLLGECVMHIHSVARVASQNGIWLPPKHVSRKLKCALQCLSALESQPVHSALSIGLLEPVLISFERGLHR